MSKIGYETCDLMAGRWPTQMENFGRISEGQREAFPSTKAYGSSMARDRSIKRIRILHLITGLQAHGAERVLAKLVKGSDKNNFCHQVVSMTDVGPVGEELIAAGVKVYALHMRRGIPSPVSLFRLAVFLWRTNPQILHCWMYHANLFGLLVGRLTGVPHIVWGIRSAHVQLANYRRLTRCVIWLCARLSRFPAAITVNSEVGRQLHQSWGYDTAKTVLIPNGFDLEIFKPDPTARSSVRAELGVDENALLVGLIARFDPVKDHATFFKGASLLISRAPRVHLVLSGDEISPDNSTLARMVRENQLDGHVHLLGPRSDVARLMASLDIACSSSTSEAFANVVAEAMACGVPCVVTDVGDSASIVCGTGCVIPPQDPQALGDACLELIAIGAPAREELGRRARNRVEKAFGLASMLCSYETLYESIVTGLAFQTAYSVAD